MQASAQDRLVSGLGTTVIVALLGYLLVTGLSVDIPASVEQATTMLNLTAPPPPPKPKEPIVRPRQTRAVGKASPRNLRNKANELVAPPPIVPLLVPMPVIAARKAGPGMAASAGASDLAGLGEGAGGQGNGSGGGGDGDGGTPPRQVKGLLSYSDLSPDLKQSGVSGSVSVSYTVGVDGRVSSCTVARSSGNGELDRLTCSLIQQRFRFDPSRDADGRPVESVIDDDRHSWEIEGEPNDGGGHRPPPDLR